MRKIEEPLSRHKHPCRGHCVIWQGESTFFVSWIFCVFLTTSQASLPGDQGLSAYRVLAGGQHTWISIASSSEGAITNIHHLLSYWLTGTGWMQPMSRFLPYLLKDVCLAAGDWWMRMWWVSCYCVPFLGESLFILLCNSEVSDLFPLCAKASASNWKNVLRKNLDSKVCPE